MGFTINDIKMQIKMRREINYIWDERSKLFHPLFVSQISHKKKIMNRFIHGNGLQHL
jgi:hypothetical protein